MSSLKFIPDAGLWIFSFPLENIRAAETQRGCNVCSCRSTSAHSSLSIFVPLSPHANAACCLFSSVHAVFSVRQRVVVFFCGFFYVFIFLPVLGAGRQYIDKFSPGWAALCVFFCFFSPACLQKSGSISPTAEGSPRAAAASYSNK